MQALILAAGEGSRLQDPLGRPKCLREVGETPLIHHQLAALASVGVLDVMIVVGYREAWVKDSVGSWARFVTNDRYAETNSMYSFLLGQRALEEDLMVLNSDVFCDPRMLQLLLATEGDAILFDSSSGEDPEQMKVQVRGGRLVGMSKTLPAAHVAGENVGILKLTRGTADDIAAAAADLIAQGHDRAWLAEAVNLVAVDHAIDCVDVTGWPWVEIDFPEDLVRAREQVFPQVATPGPLAPQHDERLMHVRRVG